MLLLNTIGRFVIPSISQICSLNSSVEDDIADYAAGQCMAIELWLTKIEEYLKTRGPAELRARLADHGVTAPVASFQGGIVASQGEARGAAWELFRRRLSLCQELGVKTLVVACDVPRPLTQELLDRVSVSLNEAAEEASKHSVRLALEFQAGAAFGNNLQSACAMVAEVGSPALGVCLDAFHYHVGPSKPEDLFYLTRDNLFHVQLADLADTPRELAADRDRILPGDGDISIPHIIARLKEIDYQGCVSLELMNPQIWQIPALQFGEIGMTALRRTLGIASM